MNATRIDRKVRVGIIGLGYWGPKLARNFHSLETARVALASDLRQDRLDDLQAHYPDIEVTRDYREMLNGHVDAVVIATPVHTHYKLAKEALLAGKHVMVEKPITSDSLQAQELLEIAGEKNLRLMVGHTFLYNPAVVKVRDLVRSGELGQVYYLNGTRVNLGLLQPDINVMWDLAPHDISILNFILGARPVKVSAVGAVYINKNRTLPEVVYVNLRYENDILANLRVSWLDPVKMRRLTVVGSKKMLVYDDISENNKITLYDKGVEVPPYSVTEDEFRASYRNGPEEVIPLDWVEPLKAECSRFIDCIRKETCQRDCIQCTDGKNGLQIVRILESAQRSLTNGGLELNVEY